MAGIAGEVAFACDEFIETLGVAVERFGELAHLVVGVLRQLGGVELRGIRRRRVEPAYRPCQRDDGRERAAGGAECKPGRQVQHQQHHRERQQAEHGGELADAAAVEHQVQPFTAPVRHEDHGIDAVDHPVVIAGGQARDRRWRGAEVAGEVHGRRQRERRVALVLLPEMCALFA